MGQILNPFRLILKITIMPLRILLFLGHLIGIGVTADRVPGVPQLLSTLLGIISEGFEDLHYFAGHAHEHTHHHEQEAPVKRLPTSDERSEHLNALLKKRLGKEHGHHHNLDLPTRLLTFLFTPMYGLAALWDWAASQSNPKHVLSLKDAWNKQRGHKVKAFAHSQRSLALSTVVGSKWQKEHAVYCLERFKTKDKGLMGRTLTRQKREALTELQYAIKQTDQSLVSLLEEAKTNKLYQTHRFFPIGKTATTAFLEQLPQRITPPNTAL